MRRTTTKLATIAILSGVLAIGLGACDDGTDETHSGTLADGAGEHDGKTCDSYDVEVGAGERVTVDMTSEWDNYLYLANGSADVAYNDDTNGLNAQIAETIEAAGTYTVYACALSDQRGAYTLHVVTGAPD